MSGAFFDTNVLIYAFADGAKAEIARTCLLGGGVISVQSLNEFAAVMRGKLRMSWPHIHDEIEQLLEFCELAHSVDLASHRRGLELARRYDLAIFDSMIFVSALQNGCDTFFSEDMHDGLVIDGTLTIRNPFR